MFRGNTTQVLDCQVQLTVADNTTEEYRDLTQGENEATYSNIVADEWRYMNEWMNEWMKQ